MQLAVTLDPRSPAMKTQLARSFYLVQAYEEAVALTTAVLDQRPDFVPALRVRGLALGRLGRGDEAVEDLERAGVLAGEDHPQTAPALACSLAWAGRDADARRILARQEEVNGDWPYTIAAIHACLGDVDEAFEWLDRAVEVRAESLTGIGVSRTFSVLRGDPRFDRILELVGLSSYRLPPRVGNRS